MTSGLKPYPAYKDSGVPWLGKVPLNWEVLPHRAIFAEVNDRNHVDEAMLSVTISRGVIPQRTLLADGAKKDSSNLDKSAYKLVCPGDLAYNKMRAWQGAIGVSNRRGIVSPAYVVLRLRNGDDDPAYYHHLLRMPAFAKEAERWSYGITSDMWSLRPEHFRLIYSCRPSASEQKAIGRFVSHVDVGVGRYIRAKQKLIALLNEQKQAVIQHAVTRGLDPNVRLKRSGVAWLGDVPAHWRVDRLRAVSPCVTVGVVVNPSTYFTDEGVPMLLGNNVLPGGFQLDAVRHISSESNALLRRTQLRTGDVVVVRVGAPGVAAVVPPSLDGCNCASILIVRKGIAFVSEWMEFLFNSQVLRRQIDQVKYGAAQKQFNVGHALDFLCPLPPLAEQRDIVAHLTARLRRLERAVLATTSSVEMIREYRARLIADVVTGQLDVREASARLPQDEAGEPESFEPNDLPEDAGREGEAGAEPEPELAENPE